VVSVQVIAIDGPAGSGKSTAARGVADALGLHTLDTGAMYRAVTLAALEAGIDVGDGDAAAAVAARAHVDVDDGRAVLDGRDVSDEIRGPDVTAAVSAVSAHPAVRRILVERQRDWARAHGGGVVEGRDIGTVVFPDAPVKVFLTARDDVRAARRRRDEEAASRDVAVDEVRDAIAARDRADASLGRALRPEDAADDAMVIDTSTTDVEDVVGAIVHRARAVAERASPRAESG
jgi:cytidylate kinase